MQFRDLPPKNVQCNMMKYFTQELCSLQFPYFSGWNILFLTNVLWKDIRYDIPHNMFYPCFISSLCWRAMYREGLYWVEWLFYFQYLVPSDLPLFYVFSLIFSVIHVYLFFASLRLVVNIRLKHSSLVLCQWCQNWPKKQYIKCPSSMVFHFELHS